MKKKSIYIVFFLLIALFVSKAYSIPLRTDTVKIHAVVPSHAKIESYKSNSDFNYETKVVSSESFFDRIMDWIFRTLDKLFSNEGIAPFIRYTLIAGLIIFIVLRLMNVKFQTLFYKNRKQQPLLLTNEEMEIMESDLDEMIGKEIINNNFRFAVRYLYLKLLKALNDKEYIHLQAHKTNYDFQYEMKDKACAKDFAGLSKVFEFVWYGDFAIGKEIFSKIYGDFNTIFTQLND